MAMFGLLLVMCTPLGTAIPLSSFYSYGSAAGDNRLPTTDDGSSTVVSLPSSFLFFGTSYTTLYVSLLCHTLQIASFPSRNAQVSILQLMYCTVECECLVLFGGNFRPFSSCDLLQTCAPTWRIVY